ncbi:sigma-70 family RNA polymerase sigma factor, partial [Streptosporangium sp. NPDC050280]|uniref:RNA polymerase sigma factor n=1 Tax=unclassified Streptosporangium TaxID=2632669 RepID=UPI0034251717
KVTSPAFIYAEPSCGFEAFNPPEDPKSVQALAGLSEADKEILTLTTWHGLSTTEAAEVLGCTKAAFFVRLHRARRRLQSAIEATGTTSRKPVTVPGRKLR